MFKGIILAIRYCLTLLLLIVVWQHAHWSVALCLTLIAIDIELSNWEEVP